MASMYDPLPYEESSEDSGLWLETMISKLPYKEMSTCIEYEYQMISCYIYF